MLDADFLALRAYCENLAAQPDTILDELERETNLSTITPQMLSGRFQGKLLELLARIKQPRRVLEIGTFTGYSAICMSRGLAAGGVIDTIEVDPEREQIIRKYFDRAGIREQVVLHMADATQVIPQLDATYDLVFIDAGKREYPLYYDLVMPKLAPGALLLVDNVLWGGKVIRPEPDLDTAAIIELNEKMSQDDRIASLILPIRDGLHVAIKK